MVLATPRVRILSLCLGLALASCRADLFLSTSNLEIGPDPAEPGDMVVASFVLSLAPTQRHTITLYIDDIEHLRVTTSDPPAVPMLLQLGDAEDLIDSYGTGEHSAYIEVHVPDRNRTSRTQSDIFELQAATP